jgi:hypothetical protein
MKICHLQLQDTEDERRSIHLHAVDALKAKLQQGRRKEAKGN